MGGRSFKDCPAVDLRCRPSLEAFRFQTLINNHVAPIPRQKKRAVRMWVPSSASEMKHKRRRSASAPEATSKARSRPAPSQVVIGLGITGPGRGVARDAAAEQVAEFVP